MLLAEKNCFVMCVEEAPKIEILASLPASAKGIPPHLIVDKDGTYFVLSGQYASPGNRFRYIRRVPYSI